MARAATLETGSDTRERILVAALQAFAEKGYDGATTREIASRAGVNLGLLQYHFGGKPKLWQAAKTCRITSSPLRRWWWNEIVAPLSNPETRMASANPVAKRGPTDARGDLGGIRDETAPANACTGP